MTTLQPEDIRPDTVLIYEGCIAEVLEGPTRNAWQTQKEWFVKIHFQREPGEDYKVGNVALSDCHPVPLSAPVLEAVSWDDDQVEINDGHDMELRMDDDSYVLYARVPHLHLFQNAYRVRTEGRDLTINLDKLAEAVKG